MKNYHNEIEYLKLDNRQLYDFLSYSRRMISHAKISAIKSSRRELKYDANPNGIAIGVHWVDLEWPWRGTALDGAELPPARFRHAAAVVLSPRSISHLTPPTIFWISPPFLCPSLSHPHSYFCPASVCSSTSVRYAANCIRLHICIYTYVQGVPKPPT